MIVNRGALLRKSPIANMEETKLVAHGTSYGLSEAGYDIRIAEEVLFHRGSFVRVDVTVSNGNFALASAMEKFQMPPDLVGIVHDKSTWARRGLSVLNTVIEPGWKGFLTLELVYHGTEELLIPAGSGIAQVIFHEIAVPAQYEGKYQNQEEGPQEARESV